MRDLKSDTKVASAHFSPNGKKWLTNSVGSSTVKIWNAIQEMLNRNGEVDEAVWSSINLAEEKPVVVCANVMNEATFNDELRLNMINEKLSEISERGIHKTIAYPRQETEHANKINIRYEIKGNVVICQIRLIKRDEQMYSDTVTGSKEDLEALSLAIIEKVVVYAK